MGKGMTSCNHWVEVEVAEVQPGLAIIEGQEYEDRQVTCERCGGDVTVRIWYRPMRAGRSFGSEERGRPKWPEAVDEWSGSVG